MNTVVKVFTVRVIYKSGAMMDFDCTEFNIKGPTFSWVPFGTGPRPLTIGADDVAAVWQLGVKDVEQVV